MLKFFLLICFAATQAACASARLEQTVDEVVSVFENNTVHVQYAYIEDIHDGRGYTAGRAGFTTATGDLIQVVDRYQRGGGELFAPVVKLLRRRAKDEDPSTEGLEELPRIWRAACDEERFLRAQDELVEELYKRPARGYANRFKLSSPLAYLVIYDTIIQHGEGDDPDSINGILKKMGARPTDERAFLLAFLKARREVLLNPSDHATQAEWRKSVGRVTALKSLLVQEKWDLATPFMLDVWGHRHRID